METVLWLRSAETESVRPGTIDGYQRIENRIDPLLGSRLIWQNPLSATCPLDQIRQNLSRHITVNQSDRDPSHISLDQRVVFSIRR
jgi:hypothetical protein